MPGGEEQGNRKAAAFFLTVQSLTSFKIEASRMLSSWPRINSSLYPKVHLPYLN